MLPGFEMMGCDNLAVPAEVMRHVVHVESSANPFAIGVVGGRLVRQPRNLEEAVATARMLEEKGYNFSLGAAQVNRANFGRYGLDTHEKAFDLCANLSAGSRILAECYKSAGNDWGKAFSCYYSGNFVTGFQHGYVQKVYDSISRSLPVAEKDDTPAAIAVVPADAAAAPLVPGTREAPTAARMDPAAHRVAIRSTTLGPPARTAAAMPTAVAQVNLSPNEAPLVQTPSPPAQVNPANMPAARTTPKPEIFVPQVRGPGDPASVSPPTPPTAVPPAQPAATADPAHRNNGGTDGAFVF